MTDLDLGWSLDVAFSILANIVRFSCGRMWRPGLGWIFGLGVHQFRSSSKFTEKGFGLAGSDAGRVEDRFYSNKVVGYHQGMNSLKELPAPFHWLARRHSCKHRLGIRISKSMLSGGLSKESGGLTKKSRRPCWSDVMVCGVCEIHVSSFEIWEMVDGW